MTNRDFIDWKSNPVTQYVFKSLAERIYDAQVTLGRSAGIDPLSDRYIAGMIQAFTETLIVEFNDIDQETN